MALRHAFHHWHINIAHYTCKYYNFGNFKIWFVKCDVSYRIDESVDAKVVEQLILACVVWNLRFNFGHQLYQKVNCIGWITNSKNGFYHLLYIKFNFIKIAYSFINSFFIIEHYFINRLLRFVPHEPPHTEPFKDLQVNGQPRKYLFHKF